MIGAKLTKLAFLTGNKVYKNIEGVNTIKMRLWIPGVFPLFLFYHILSNKQTPLSHRCSRKFLPVLVHETDAWTAPNPNHRAVAASPDGNPSRRREFEPQSSRGKRGRVDRRRKKVRAGGRSGGGEAGKRLSPVAKGATCFFYVADAERVAEFSRRRRLEEALRVCCSSARLAQVQPK
jgi:hypothetical protein